MEWHMKIGGIRTEEPKMDSRLRGNDSGIDGGDGN
jgi:hypothetical protein